MQTQTTEAPTGPAIAALPEPTLEAQLADALKERDSYEQVALARVADLAKRDARIEDLLARLNALERNPVFFTLNNIDAGMVLDEAGRDMSKLCAEVRRLNAGGKIEITIGMKPLDGSDKLVMAAKFKTTVPKPAPTLAVFFADPDGKLSREDPKQLEMRLERREERAR